MNESDIRTMEEERVEGGKLLTSKKLKWEKQAPKEPGDPDAYLAKEGDWVFLTVRNPSEEGRSHDGTMMKGGHVIRFHPEQAKYAFEQAEAQSAT
jgi:hypothetical protein